MSERYDVVIIGGGAAGLRALQELSRKGKRAILLEGRTRLGGRILTLHDLRSPLPIELGPEFIHGEPDETLQLVREGALLYEEIPDVHWWSANGRWKGVHDFWSVIDRIRSRIRVPSDDQSVSEFLQQAKSIRGVERDLFIGFVEGYHAAEITSMSAKAIAAGDEETKDDSENRQFRLVSGYDRLIEWLRAGAAANGSEIRTNFIVNQIEWSEGSVTITGTSATGRELPKIRASAALITVPLGVLAAKSIRFVPELGTKKSNAISRLGMGDVAKIVFRFREAFWEEDDFVRSRARSDKEQRMVFVHARRPTVTCWTALPSKLPMLTFWAGGPEATRLLALEEPRRVDLALEHLATILAMDRSELESQVESWHTHDWSSDPFSRGAYSYVLAGGAAAQKELAKPLRRTLFFAGEATDAEQTGTVAGALASGKRAAKEILKR